MKCVILQPSYIPWRGYFDLIHRADVFVFYDDVQYDKGSWRNRNRIKSPRGSIWLTIPVHSRGSITRHIPIESIEIVSDDWASRHLATLIHSYRRAPHFADYLPWLEQTYASPPQRLADFTIRTTIELAGFLGIEHCRFLRSSEIAGISGAKTERLVAILNRLGATEYLSGPSAKDYIEESQFADAGIALEWMTYQYPEYPQLYPPFDPFVSVLDLLFMKGPRAGEAIWGSR